MVISCPKCSSRYQLADDKIRPTGTKVRCPKCQNTFRVFPEVPDLPQDDEPPTEKTEYFQRPDFGREKAEQEKEYIEEKTLTQKRDPFEAKPAPKVDPEPQPTFEPASPYQDPFGGRTNIADLPLSRKKSPFKRKSEPEVEAPPPEPEDVDSEKTEFGAEFPKNLASPSTPASQKFDEETDAEAVRSERASRKPKPTAERPFGDETFLEIRNVSNGKGFGKKVLGVAVAILLIAAAIISTQKMGFPKIRTSKKTAESTPKAETNTVQAQHINRPPNWYRDDPTVFQDFLSQMATLPTSDQQKPEVKAALGEALILNGLLSGASDQVATGLGFSSSLIAAHPNSSYGFYGLSAFAVYKEDVATLGDLISKWPKFNLNDPEYRLAHILVVSRAENDLNTGFEELKQLLSDQPDFQRAYDIAMSLSLDHPVESEKILGSRLVEQIEQSYQRHHDFIRGQSSTLPALFQIIDKKLSKRSPAAVKATPKPAPASTPPAIAKAEARDRDPTTTKLLNEKMSKKLEERRKLIPPTPEIAEQAPPKVKTKVDKKHLPKPTAELIAKNKSSLKEKTEAEQLYRQGNSMLEDSKPDEALVLYRKALSLYPDFADIYKKMGNIYKAQNENERAISSFKMYLQLKPESSDRGKVENILKSLE